MSKKPGISNDVIRILNDFFKTDLSNNEIQRVLNEGKCPQFDGDTHSLVFMTNSDGTVNRINISNTTVAKYRQVYKLANVDISKVKLDYSSVKTNEIKIEVMGMKILTKWIEDLTTSEEKPKVNEISLLNSILRDIRNLNSSNKNSGLIRKAQKVMDQFKK